jgi:hypothetical protein
MSIGMTPFRTLYGYDAPTLIDLVFGESRAPKAKDWITKSQEILKLLKENLQTTQNRQKVSVDRHRIERSFEVGDLVFLRLQPYRQSSLKKSWAERLKPRFYGPYRIMRRVGEVAYELEILEGSKIHNVFYTYLASRRWWDNSSTHQRSFPHWMRRDSWSWFRRRYWSSESGN